MFFLLGTFFCVRGEYNSLVLFIFIRLQFSSQYDSRRHVFILQNSIGITKIEQRISSGDIKRAGFVYSNRRHWGCGVSEKNLIICTIACVIVVVVTAAIASKYKPDYSFTIFKSWLSQNGQRFLDHAINSLIRYLTWLDLTH